MAASADVWLRGRMPPSRGVAAHWVGAWQVVACCMGQQRHSGAGGSGLCGGRLAVSHYWLACTDPGGSKMCACGAGIGALGGRQLAGPSVAVVAAPMCWQRRDSRMVRLLVRRQPAAQVVSSWVVVATVVAPAGSVPGGSRWGGGG